MSPSLILTYFGMLLVFLAIDALWLTIIAKDFYQKYIGHLLASQVNFGAALVFYLLFILGILVFCVLPGVERSSLVHTLALGIFFGIVTYATYDLTNWATLKDWPALVVGIDILWGAFIASTISVMGYLLLTRLQ